MAMRVNQTYKEASDAILNDVTMWNEYMAREPKEPKKRKRPDGPGLQTDPEWTPRHTTTAGGGYKGKGKGRKGKKGEDRSQWQPWKPWRSTSTWTRPDWQRPTRWRQDERRQDEWGQHGASPPIGVPDSQTDATHTRQMGSTTLRAISPPPQPSEEAILEDDQDRDKSNSHQRAARAKRGEQRSCDSATDGDQPQARRGLDKPVHGNWWPLRGDSAKPVPALADCGDIILLSFFDGLGSAALAVQSLGIRIRACLEWEVDPCAVAVASRVCKGLRMKRGDITADDPAQVATIIRDLLHEKPSIVLATAGPPCPDYSKINASAQGREGTSGQLFVRFTEFLQKLEAGVGVQFHLLVENVLLQKSTDLEWFNQAMGAQPLAADAASFGLISRPRTWWTRVDWTKVQANPYYPDRPLRWEKLDGLMKLQLDVEQDKAEDIQMPGLSFHSAIVQKRKLLPCLTTPAPSDEGRPPPKKMKGRMSAQVRQRWLSGNRQYAPWVYEDHALVYEAGQGQIIPAELKEQLHHYPQGYTRHPQVTPRDRHRLLGNSWHVGVARFLIALVLIGACGGTRTAAAQDLDSFMAEARAREIPVAGHLQGSMKVGVKPAETMWEQYGAMATQHDSVPSAFGDSDD